MTDSRKSPGIKTRYHRGSGLVLAYTRVVTSIYPLGQVDGWEVNARVSRALDEAGFHRPPGWVVSIGPYCARVIAGEDPALEATLTRLLIRHAPAAAPRLLDQLGLWFMQRDFHQAAAAVRRARLAGIAASVSEAMNV